MLAEILKPMLYRTFDVSQLMHMQEVPSTTSLRVQRILPLQKQPGSIMLTNERLYFQSATLAKDGGLVSSWMLQNVVSFARRYAGLKDCALEVYFSNGTSLLLALERSRDREKVVSAILAQLGDNLRCLTDRDFLVEAHQEWSAGRLSNRNYLLALNASAGRSFHDLSRYPVFPWILQDYQSETLDLNDPGVYRDLTKPMGALNTKRLEYFQGRLDGMQDMERFLYGTHYSAPGYILYYLLRTRPQHMLCLQNGKFDAPDRMFYSIQHTFECALTNHADVKELIPEFFCDPEFLINAQALQLGATQLGDRVHDVLLPPWAKGSAREFLKQNKRALESPYVTQHLPQWIDLIFGFRSRGDEALEAHNLFHPTAYLGPGSELETEEERNQAELQAAEFGSVPDQLFDTAHPRKGDDVGDDFINATLGKVSHDLEGDGLASEATKQEAWELLEPPSSTTSQEENATTTSTPVISADSSDSAPREVAAATVGFGISAPMSARMKQFSSQLSPIRKTETTAVDDDDAATDLVTPGGKAKASWVSTNLSIPQDDETTPLGADHPPIDYRPQQGEISALQQPTLSHTQGEKPREISRTIGFSGSGELTSKGSKDFSFGGTGITQTSTRHQRHVSSNQNSPKLNSDFRTGWDMKMLEKKKLHSDAVSSCSLLLREGSSYVTTVSLDGSMLVNTVTLTNASNTSTTAEDIRRGFTGTLSRFYTGGLPQTEKAISTLSPYRSHTASDPLACLSLTEDGYGGNLVFAGGHDDVVMAYGINSACAVASVYSHRDAVTGLDVIPRSPLIEGSSALWSDSATHIMVSGSWDATVKVWSVVVSAGETVSINREPLAELFDADSTIVCLSATYVPGSGVAICTGCSDGSFVVWLCHDDGTKVVIHKEPPRRGAGPCAAVKWTKDQGETFLFCGFANGRLSSFLLVAGSLIKVSAVSVGVAVTCIDHAANTLIVGCADGGLRLLPIRDGASFDGKPTLWNAVNGKTSPALTCSSVGHGHDGRLLCSTGAADGSVAVFELKKAA